MNDATTNLTPAFLLRVILRRKRLFIFTFLLCVLITSVVAMRMQDSFESNAQLLIKPSLRGSFSIESATLRGNPLVESNTYYEIANTLTLLRSRAVIDRIADRLNTDYPDFWGYDPTPGPAKAESTDDEKSEGSIAAKAKRGLKKLIGSRRSMIQKSEDEARRDLQRLIVGRSINIEQIPGTTIVNVTVVFDHPEKAYLLAKLMLEESQTHYDIFFQTKGIDLLKEMVNSAEGKLDKLVQEEDNLLSEYKVADPKAEITQLMKQLGDLRRDFTQCQMTNATSGEKVKFYLDELKNAGGKTTTEPTLTSNPRWAALNAQLFSLQMERMKIGMAGATTRIDQVIERVSKDLAETEMMIEVPGRKVANPVYTRLREQMLLVKSDAAAAASKCTALSSEINSLRLRISELKRAGKRLDSVKLEKKLAEQDLQDHRIGLMTAQKAELLGQRAESSLKVIEQPILNSDPIKNRRPRVLMGGVFLGLLAGMILCFLFYTRSKEITTPTELGRATGLKVLGSIPSTRQVGIFKRNGNVHEWN